MEPGVPLERLLTVAEAADLAGMSKATVWQMIRRGLVPFVRVTPRCVRLQPSVVASHVAPMKADAEANAVHYIAVPGLARARKHVGRRIKALRLSRGLTQAGLAEAMGLPNASRIVTLEFGAHGGSRAILESMKDVAAALGVGPKELWPGAED